MRTWIFVCLIFAQSSSVFAHECAHALGSERRVRSIPSTEDFAGAYAHIIGVVGASELQLQQLRKILEAGKRETLGFFLLPETGTVIRGQMQEALRTLQAMAFAHFSEPLIQEKLSAVLEKLLEERKEANHTQSKVEKEWRDPWRGLKKKSFDFSVIYDVKASGNSVAVLSRGLYVWADIDTQEKPLLVWEESLIAANFEFLPKSKNLLLIENKKITRIDIRTGQKQVLIENLNQKNYDFKNVLVSDDEKKITAYNPGYTRVWEWNESSGADLAPKRPSLELLPEFELRTSRESFAAFSEDQSTVVKDKRDHLEISRKFHEYKYPVTIPLPPKHFGFLLNRNGKKIAGLIDNTSGRELEIWEEDPNVSYLSSHRAWNLTYKLPLPKLAFSSHAFLGDGNRVVLGNANGSVWILDLDNYRATIESIE